MDFTHNEVKPDIVISIISRVRIKSSTHNDNSRHSDHVFLASN